MFIDALTPGEKITIRVEKGTNTMEFTTEAIALTSEVELLSVQQQIRKLHSRILPVKLITDGKPAAPGKGPTPISFPEGNIVYKIAVVRDKVPYIWRRATIRRLEKANFHMLVSNEDADPAERRLSPRINLGIQGTARFLNGSGIQPVTIKNISGSGIAIVTDASLPSNLSKAGSLIQDVTFEDPEVGRRFVLSVFVIRTTKYTNGKTLYGCKLNSKTTEVTAYVNEKLYLAEQR